MVKFVGLMRRKPGMTRAEFVDYWQNVHAPLAMSVHEFGRFVRKYVQNIPLEASESASVPELPGSPGFDGVAEIWFDSIDDATKAFSEPRYLEVIRADELRFLDLPNCVVLVVREVQLIG
ncbi:MAG TPA: EthD domain-containing protein [Candidatus Binataceae bacterium]